MVSMMTGGGQGADEGAISIQSTHFSPSPAQSPVQDEKEGVVDGDGGRDSTDSAGASSSTAKIPRLSWIWGRYDMSSHLLRASDVTLSSPLSCENKDYLATTQ